MPDRLPRRHLCRACINHPLIRDPPAPAPRWPGTAPPPLPARPGKLLPQGSAGLGVGIDMLVDRFLAHPGSALQPGTGTDHLRRPTHLEPGLRLLPHRLRETPGAGLRLPLRLSYPIPAPPQVPGQLPRNAAGRSVQSPTDLPHAAPFFSPPLEAALLRFRDPFVGHVLRFRLWHPKNLTPQPPCAYSYCCNSRSRARGIKPALSGHPPSLNLDSRLGRSPDRAKSELPGPLDGTGDAPPSIPPERGRPRRRVLAASRRQNANSGRGRPENPEARTPAPRG